MVMILITVTNSIEVFGSFLLLLLQLLLLVVVVVVPPPPPPPPPPLLWLQLQFLCFVTTTSMMVKRIIRVTVYVESNWVETTTTTTTYYDDDDDDDNGEDNLSKRKHFTYSTRSLCKAVHQKSHTCNADTEGRCCACQKSIETTDDIFRSCWNPVETIVAPIHSNGGLSMNKQSPSSIPHNHYPCLCDSYMDKLGCLIGLVCSRKLLVRYKSVFRNA